MRLAARPVSILAVAALISLALAPFARAGGGSGYPPTVHAFPVDAVGRGWPERPSWPVERGEPYLFDDDGEAAPLPASFFADAGGVGPFAIDGGGSGGGYVYLASGASAFASASARASASASVGVSVRGFGGGHGHGAGGHGCGCK
jgi:hypothetical protein